MDESSWQAWSEDFKQFWTSIGRPITGVRKEDIPAEWWTRADELWSRWLDGVEEYAPGVFGVEGTYGRPLEIIWKNASKVFTASPSERKLKKNYLPKVLVRAIEEFVVMPMTMHALARLVRVSAECTEVLPDIQHARSRIAEAVGRGHDGLGEALKLRLPGYQAAIKLAEEESKRCREADWANFIKQQMESGTRFAHALTKPKCMVMVVLSGAGGVVDTPMHQFEEKEQLWADMWKCEEQPFEWEFADYQVPPDATVDQIIAAAAGFAPYTA
jgi:hypothetical protein